MKISVYIATSLDGFIARKNGDIDWLISAGNPDDPEDYGYADFMSTIDCLVMGRNTFEKVLSFPDWPYDKKVIVLSKTLKTLPVSVSDKAEIFSGNLDELVIQLKSKNFNRIYIDGGMTIQSFLAKGYVTDITLTRIPILLGEGLSLFGASPTDIRLTHLETRSFSSGFVQSTYQL